MLRRARITFVAALVVGALVLASELPFSEILHARAAVASASTSLSKIDATNKSLATQIEGLKQGSTIEKIAHEQYGLVEPGEKAVVVMPGGRSGARVHGGGATGPATPLGSETIPKSDLVPTDSALSPGAPERVGHGGGGFWQSFVHRLEFWRASN